MFFLSAKYSHQQEINERLSFLHEFAMNSDFKISKAELKVIYGLLTESPVKSDYTEFLTWCNTACKAQTRIISVLDLDEVGEYFSELISTRSLNLAELPVVGFEFLKMYFTSANHAEQKLLKISPPEKKKSTTGGGWYSTGYGNYGMSNDKEEEPDEPQDDEATFKICVDPAQLTKIEMVTTMAMYC